jgi:hypothetical protein
MSKIQVFITHIDLHHQRPTQTCRVSAAALLAVW